MKHFLSLFPSIQPASTRLGCLDTFRGLSLYLMIFVNYGGGGYHFFNHSDWNGLTVADLLFPWFMWMMGVSMSLTYSNFNQRAARAGVPEEEYVYSLYVKAVRRAAVFFGIGLWMNDGFDYGEWRIPGVLQYFAVSYLVTALTILGFREHTRRGLRAREPILEPLTHRDWPHVFQCYSHEWIVQLLILLVNLLVVLFAKAPGCPIGYDGPGGLSEDSAHYECAVRDHQNIFHII